METLINYNEDDVAELQKNLYDHRAQLDKCKKDLHYLEAYSRRENVNIFGVPQATGNENSSEPEDTKEIGVYLGVRTCELFLCFVSIVRVRAIMLTSLFSLFYVTGEFHRFLHRCRARNRTQLLRTRIKD